MTKSEAVLSLSSVDNDHRHDPQAYRISTIEIESGVQSIFFNMYAHLVHLSLALDASHQRPVVTRVS